MKGKLIWIVGVVVLLLALGVTVGLAQDTVTYYACVNKSSGTIHMIDKDDTCNKHEMRVEWNQKGEKGDKGDTGPAGSQGEPGADGEDGTSCTVTQNNGSATIHCTDNSSATVLDGAPGADGAQGPPGETGPQGEQGPQGLPGSPGADGADGAPGADGLPGEPGVDGADGLHCWDLNGNGVGDPGEDVNGDLAIDVLDCQGSQGEQGPEGPEGPQGPPGPAGIPTDQNCPGGQTVTGINSDGTLQCTPMPVVLSTNAWFETNQGYTASLFCPTGTLPTAVSIGPTDTTNAFAYCAPEANGTPHPSGEVRAIVYIAARRVGQQALCDYELQLASGDDPVIDAPVDCSCWIVCEPG